ncbi:MAG: hypothetical protein U1E65_09475 [Myxococcota bacterium]
MEARPITAFLALCSLGCAPSPTFTMASPDPSAAMTLLGFNAPGESPHISVVTPDAPWLLAADHLPLDLRALSYPSALPGLVAGPLPGFGEQTRCDLLDYRSAASLAVRSTDDLAGSWVKSEGHDDHSDAWLYGERLGHCIGSCTTWSETQLHETSAVVGLKVAHDEAVIFTVDGGVLSTDGASFRPICGPSLGLGTVSTGTWDGGDALWIGHPDGRIQEMRRSEQVSGQPCVVRAGTQTPNGREVSAMDVAPAGEAFELFVLAAASSKTTWMARWDGQRFGPEIQGSTAQFSAQVLRLSAGRAIGTADNPEILVIHEDVSERLPMPIASTVEGVTAAQSLDAEGPASAWIGVSHVGPCRFELPARWTVPADPSGAFSVDNVLRFPGRTYFTSARIRLHESPDRGPACVDSEVFPRHGSATMRIQAWFVRRLNATQVVIGGALEEDGGANVLNRSIRILTRTGGSP